MRALLIEPGSRYLEIHVETHAGIGSIIGGRVEVRPFTLTPPLLSIAMDEDFVRKGLQPSLYHPTYRTRYVLCGPLVIFRATLNNTLVDLSESDIRRAVAIISEFAVGDVLAHGSKNTTID